MALVFAAALLLAALGWIAAGAAGWWALGRVPRLPPFPRTAPRLSPASVIVPARDEAERIGGTLERLLAQQHVELEIVVVDDRSRDATAAIVEALAARDARVRLVRVRELPPGWLGKTHACELGARAASGEWLLFTDGDIHLASDVLARALLHAQREEAEHVVLAPAIEGQSLAAAAATAAFGATMLPMLAAANTGRGHAGIGIGAFNLVRRSAWQALGGHARLRLEVVDDIGLGQELARAGLRTRACFGAHEVVADWARTLRGVPRALEKNLFAQLDYSTAKTLAFCVLAVLFGAAPLAGLVLACCADGNLARAGGTAALAPLASLPASLRAARVSGSGLLPALLSPLFCFVLPWSALNSAFVTLRQGGVRWRDTFHPLAELRAARSERRRGAARAG